MKELKLEAKVENLPVVTEFLCSLGANAIPGVLLAAEEIFVNIALYAYTNGGCVHLRAGAEQDFFVMEFTDEGTPFDPLMQQTPNTDAPAALRQAGGLGIHMVKSVMDDLCYERKDHENRLSLKIRIP